MVERCHQFKEFEQTRGDSEEQGSILRSFRAQRVVHDLTTKQQQHCLMLWLHIKFLIIITAAV